MQLPLILVYRIAALFNNAMQQVGNDLFEMNREFEFE